MQHPNLKTLNQMLMMIIPEISAFFIFGYLLVWQQEQKNFKCVIIKLKWMERQRNLLMGKSPCTWITILQVLKQHQILEKTT